MVTKLRVSREDPAFIIIEDFRVCKAYIVSCKTSFPLISEVKGSQVTFPKPCNH